MDYIEVTVNCTEEYQDVFTAELAEEGYESFMETEAGIQAYIPMETFDALALRALSHQYREQSVKFVVKMIPQQNWNEEWEKNYPPIRVENKILVRAHFHEPEPEYAYQIEINPKMSFGTGHHATTHLMLAAMLTLKVEGKRVYDVGSGTGILAIMACKLGAAHVDANDVEDWTVENCRENCQLNGYDTVQVYYGALPTLGPQSKYQLILANINRNVLLEEIPLYEDMMQPNGDLLLSGFYEADVPMLLEKAESLGLQCKSQTQRNEWTCLHLFKPAA